MSNEMIKLNIDACIVKLFEDDGILFAINSSEMSICSSLAWHIKSIFNTWNVDCEYNRDGDEAKRMRQVLAIPDSADVFVNKYYDRLVLPDIIIHKRTGKGMQHNLLVIEVKKTTNTDDIGIDIAKLKYLTKHHKDENANFQYQYGLFVMFTAYRELAPGILTLNANLQWIVDSEEQRPYDIPIICKVSETAEKLWTVERQ